MHQHNHDERAHHHASVPANGSPGEQATCPVMHMPVNKQEAEDDGFKRTYNGKDYYMCCQTCAANFDSDPAHYAT